MPARGFDYAEQMRWATAVERAVARPWFCLLSFTTSSAFCHRLFGRFHEHVFQQLFRGEQRWLRSRHELRQTAVDVLVESFGDTCPGLRLASTQRPHPAF